jgi:hypothetical protein
MRPAQVLHHLRLAYSNLKATAQSRHDPKALQSRTIPYYSQWESPALAEQILAKTLAAQADPQWRRSGATTADEYAEWSWNGCGMACLKMILADQGIQVPLVTLAKQCLSYGGYQKPLASSPGLFYKPFCQFVKTMYHLEAAAISALTTAQILHHIAQHHYVIASVNYEIRNPQSTPTKKGGHLVLITGYNKEKQSLSFHNPSGTKTSTQMHAEITFKDFEKFFAHKGIVVYSKTKGGSN